MQNKSFEANGELMVPSTHSVDLIRPESLHGGMWASLELDLLDSSGRLVDRREQPCRSFLRNYGIICRQILGVLNTVSNDTVTDIGGTVRRMAVIDSENSINENAGPFSTSLGRLHFGDSSTAVASTQYGLQGVEFLTGVNVATTTITENAAMYKYQYEGSILNNTGVSKTIREIILTAFMRRGDAASANNEVTLMRDTMADVVVADGLTLVGRYKFTAAV